MLNSNLFSAIILTGLLAIGLLFFIKASTKDRTEILEVQVVDRGLPQQIFAYLVGRGYRPVLSADKTELPQPETLKTETLLWQGQVQASIALLLFLATLASIGIGSLGLVLGIIWPDLWSAKLNVLTMTIGAIGTGWFYWRGANRKEEVKVSRKGENFLLIQAHRDELANLQKALDNLALTPEKIIPLPK